MSIAEAPDPVVTASGKPGTADGSPPAGTARAEETTTGSEDVLGSEPETTEQGGADPSAQELARLQQQQAEWSKKSEELEYLRTVVDGINADPEILKFVQERMNGGKQADPIEEASRMFEGLDKDSENPGAWKRSMEKALRAAAEAGAAKAIAELQPQLGSLNKSLNGNLVEAALIERGMDPKVIKTAEFKALAKEMRTDGMFPVGMKADAKARSLINEWNQRNGARTVNVAERERLARVKGANHLNGTNPRASATTPKKFIYDSNDPELLSKRSEWMAQNPGATSADFVNVRKQAPRS